MLNPTLSDPVLSAVQKAMVKEIWNNPSNNDETLVKEFDLEIKGAALKKCDGRTWLDDQVDNLTFLFLTSFLLIKLYIYMHVCIFIYLYAFMYVHIISCFTPSCLCHTCVPLFVF